MSAVQAQNGTNGTVQHPLPDDTLIDCKIEDLHYGKFKAVRDIALKIKKGHHHCLYRTLRMRQEHRAAMHQSDERFGARFSFPRARDLSWPGHLRPSVDPVAVRRHIGMVFQQPNPFAMSIFRNVAFGLRLNRYKGSVNDKVEQALRQAALWDEVKDKLHSSGLALSGGQQQRLCIARAIATEPAVLLMDEPVRRSIRLRLIEIEELMKELKKKYTIAIVTHNLQQAKRVADMTAFLYVDTTQGGRTGYQVEYGPTEAIFENPKEKHTKDYLSGEFS